MAGGLNLKVDTSALLKFAARTATASKMTKPVLAAGVNSMGDRVVSLIATTLTQSTGLTLEQVRGMIKVKRASRDRMNYEVIVSKRLMTEKVDTLAGQREIRDFGTRQPGELVIIKSKNDELVCMDCEELAAAGPMPIEIAKAHVPKHPECRCIIMPYSQPGKRLPVTMTTLSGTSASRRAGRKRISIEQDVTMRQLAQNVLNNAGGKLRIALK